MVALRNPLAAFAQTVAGTSVLSFLVGVPILFLPQRELVFFYLPFVLFAVGFVSARSSFIGMLGFVGATLGGFVGISAYLLLLNPSGWPVPPWLAGFEFLVTLGFAAACGLGGFSTGALGLRRMERMADHAMKMRRCGKCGAKVGVAARKCWSCHSYLPPT
ncbi:MAG TPA: hypothetical protein VJP06_04535 [Thermoplasmata archaeon]|nr:hypothetical protein [Thermoplasmata archaeon]